MHIQERKLKDGTKSFRFVVHRDNKYISKVFRDKKIGERWAKNEETSIEKTGLPSGIKERKKHTVGEIYQKYLDEVPRGESDITAINTFLKSTICTKLNLAEWKVKHCYAYRDARLKDVFYPKGAKIGIPVTSRTVEREEHTLQRVISHAIARQWDGCEGLENPWAKMEPIEGATFERIRTLKPGELKQLEEAAKKCRGFNKLLMPLAIWFAIFTGMRLQEIFNLTWGDINCEDRTIRIKTHKGSKKQKRPERYIVFPFIISLLLSRNSGKEGDLPTICDGKVPQLTDRVFARLTKLAFKQSWRDVVKRAGIPGKRVSYTLNGQTIEPDGEGLEFKDLRREAGSRFAAAGLTGPEHDLMMGHTIHGSRVQKIYIKPTPDVVKSIADKLDKHMFGMTLDEILARGKENAARGDAIRAQIKDNNDAIPDLSNVVQFKRGGK